MLVGENELLSMTMIGIRYWRTQLQTVARNHHSRQHTVEMQTRAVNRESTHVMRFAHFGDPVDEHATVLDIA